MKMQSSNKDVDWSKVYDHYEVEMREMYRTVSKSQNESHFEMLKSKAVNYLKGDKIFCEIGFSAGLTLRLAMPYFKKVYGLDISPRNVEYTKNELLSEGHTNFEIFSSDIMKYDSTLDNKFDVISFIHGLEHFSNEDYPVLFANIKRYLKPSGIFTGALPYKNRFNYRMCPHCNRLFEIDGHLTSHDENSLRQLFEDNSLDIILIQKFNKGYSLKKGYAVKRMLKRIYFLLNNKVSTQLEYIVMPR